MAIGLSVLQAFVEYTPAAVAMFDRDMRYLAHSRRWLEDYRLGDENLVGRSHYEIFPEMPERWRAIHQRCLAGGIERSEQEEFRRADGSTDWVRWEVRPWTDDHGAIGGLMLFTEVITDRLRAEATLRASEERYRDLVETVSDVIFEIDASGAMNYLSPAFASVSSYAAEELIGRPFASFLHPDDLPAVLANFERTLRDIREPLEFRVLDRDGSVRWVRTLSRPIFADGVVIALRGVMTDVTERRRAEDVYRAVFEHSVEGLAVIQDGRWILGNPALTRLTGYRLDELTALEPAERARRLVHPDDLERVMATMRVWLSGGAPNARMDFRLLRRDGEVRHVFTANTRFEYGGRPAILVAWVDISDRWAAEQALRTLNSSLEARVAERTLQLEITARELGTFSYSVSHDLRAPLRAIDGFAQAVLEDCGAQLTPTCVGYLGRVRAGTQRMGELIDQLLALSRVMRSELHHTAVDVSALAREVMAELERAEPQRTVRARIVDGLHASGDVTLLRSVLSNLLGNAWKFTRPRAVAEIEVGRHDDGPTAAFYVRDNGVGFDMAYADKLFGAFQRLHGADEFDGSGIGLATVERIVARHGGRVWGEGAVDRGATFYFTLPA
ncbi:MAG: PAS domain S-box protein [Candidatus Binatia bacterium]